VASIKRSQFSPKYLCIGAVIALVAGVLLARVSSLPFWVGTLIVAAAMFLNGLFASFEDKQPGSFHNPNEDQK
jgi:ABC-type multidrug transport system permease subunit